MFRLAIVEDTQEAADQLKAMLQQYAKECGLDLEIFTYENAVAFLTNYPANFDIVFMDIEMPYLNGLEGAAKMRKVDQSTLLIFATRLGHMALKGYEVEAFDFVVKPFHYDSLKLKLKRAFNRLEQNQVNNISFLSEGTRIRISASLIRYVEVSDHQLIYHTNTEDYPVYGTLTKVREQLEPLGFSLCNNCYLVNLRYVKAVQKYTVLVGDTELQISRPRRKAFLEALSNYIGG